MAADDPARPVEGERHGWDLVTSRPLTPAQRERIAELSRLEHGGKAEAKPKRTRKRKDRTDAS